MQIPKIRSTKEIGLLTLKGMAMGAADVVPGVSGGTIALISGIYDELLYSLKSLTPEKVLVLIKQGPVEFWQKINGMFLLAVFAGILMSVVSFARLVEWSLENHPLYVWGLFSGLIAASLYVLIRQHQTFWAIKHLALFILGTAIVVGLSLMSPTQLPAAWWMLFLGGFVAISAMILPGISGSFILLLFGLYPALLRAINEFNIIFLVSFMAGCVCGLLVFSRFLSWLLQRCYAPTLSVMLGFLLGSLFVTWPWKHTLTTMIDRHGDVIPLMQENVLPATYALVTAQNAQLGGVMLSAFAGIMLVLLTEFRRFFVAPLGGKI